MLKVECLYFLQDSVDLEQGSWLAASDPGGGGHNNGSLRLLRPRVVVKDGRIRFMAYVSVVVLAILLLVIVIIVLTIFFHSTPIMDLMKS